MEDFISQIDQLQKELEQSVNLSIEDQERITKAGARVYEQQLENNTPESGYSHKGRTLKDDIHSTPGTVDGTEDGSTSVGWSADKNGLAYIARFMNDGTKNYPRHAENDHRGFVTNTQKQAFNDVINAQFREYKKILKQKGLDK